jgi:hypothetical protein
VARGTGALKKQAWAVCERRLQNQGLLRDRLRSTSVLPRMGRSALLRIASAGALAIGPAERL